MNEKLSDNDIAKDLLAGKNEICALKLKIIESSVNPYNEEYIAPAYDDYSFDRRNEDAKVRNVKVKLAFRIEGCSERILQKFLGAHGCQIFTDWHIKNQKLKRDYKEYAIYETSRIYKDEVFSCQINHVDEIVNKKPVIPENPFSAKPGTYLSEIIMSIDAEITFTVTDVVFANTINNEEYLYLIYKGDE